MASKAFHIELRVSNVDDPERVHAVQKALQEAAQQLAAAVTLIVGDNVQPEIVLYGEDFRNGREDIELHSSEEML